MLISSPEEMYELWKSLAKEHKVLLLKWELWAWKTTLIKWFADWLWINAEKVQSPTYAYVNIYDDNLLHIDMYRLSDFNELIEKWILNQISDFDNVVIEWPKRENELDLINPLVVSIEKISASEREVTLW
jgi:tRNA threonylcarbamoyl adenosine modification protein YjeE